MESTESTLIYDVSVEKIKCFVQLEIIQLLDSATFSKVSGFNLVVANEFKKLFA